MKRNFKLYAKLFLSTFYLSAFTFGGGYVIIPLMRKKFVEQYRWLGNEEMLDLVAIAQSSPGSIATNASIILGYRIGGILGALVAMLGTILPPLIILSAVTYIYALFRDNAVVNAVLDGMQAGVAAIILSVVLKMGGEIVKGKNLVYILLMLAAFAANYFFSVNVLWIIFASGAVGLIVTLISHNRGRGKKWL